VLCTITASLTPRIGGADRTGGGGAPDIAAEGTTGVVLAYSLRYRSIRLIDRTAFFASPTQLGSDEVAQTAVNRGAPRVKSRLWGPNGRLNIGLIN